MGQRGLGQTDRLWRKMITAEGLFCLVVGMKLLRAVKGGD